MQLVALVFKKSKIMCNLPVLWCLCIRNKSASAGSFPGGKWDDDGFTHLVVQCHPVGILPDLDQPEFKLRCAGEISRAAYGGVPPAEPLVVMSQYP